MSCRFGTGLAATSFRYGRLMSTSTRSLPSSAAFGALNFAWLGIVSQNDIERYGTVHTLLTDVVVVCAVLHHLRKPGNGRIRTLSLGSSASARRIRVDFKTAAACAANTRTCQMSIASKRASSARAWSGMKRQCNDSMGREKGTDSANLQSGKKGTQPGILHQPTSGPRSSQILGGVYYPTSRLSIV